MAIVVILILVGVGAMLSSGREWLYVIALFVCIMAWFKKDKRVSWFDITRGNYKKEVENLVKKWHNTEYAKKN